MCIHLFGNSPSPLVASYRLHWCVDEPCDSDIREFVTGDFYVNDGLSFHNTETEALDILLRKQQKLKKGQIIFQKYALNSQSVMDTLSPEDRAKQLCNINLDLGSTPLQCSFDLN